MTSLFDQYEQEAQRSHAPTLAPPPDITSGGLLSMAAEVADALPMFCKQKVNFAPTDSITHLAVSSETLVLAMANSILLRIDLRQPDKPQEFDLQKCAPNMRLCGLHQDPTGSHLLIAFSADLFYLNKTSNKIKPTSKLRGQEVSAVGWSPGPPPAVQTTTRPVLLGTSRGLLVETELAVDTERRFNTGIEQYYKQLFDIGKGKSRVITGLELHRVDGTSRYFVLAATPDRIYQFIGSVANPDERPLLNQVFSRYLTLPEGFLEIPSALKYSCLHFFAPSPFATPTAFAWLTGPGVFFGQLDTSGEESLLSNSQLLNYPNAKASGGGDSAAPPPPPLALVLTQFHALLQYTDHVAAISILDQQLVFQDFYQQSYGKLVSITKDPVKGTIWVVQERAVFRYKVTHEDRNVWQIYVDKGEFELAKEFCRNNPAHLAMVLTRQAETLFERKQYDLSASLYADTQASFEEIALKFLQVWELQALKTFLKKKLSQLDSSEKAQITMLVLWVVELSLNQLGSLRTENRQNTAEYENLQVELDTFLAHPAVEDSVRHNKGSVYGLMAAHGDKQNLIRLTIAHKDFERVLRHHINKGEFLEAVDVLRRQPASKELWYSFAPALLQAATKAMVQALIEQGRTLDPVRLLPGLVAARSVQASELIKYLEHSVHSLNCQEQALHNFLLSLYAEHRPDKLMKYLAMQGEEVSMVNYDVHSALRVCREYGRTEACVQLSALLGLWQSAVEMALSVSVDIAKQTANMPADTDLRKRLWLMIAEHVVNEKNDIEQATEFLQQCDLIKVEDILPFFPDFTTIDHFKESICTSLQEYNQHIQDLKEEMEDATRSAESIRLEVQNFRKRYQVVRSNDRCCSCNLQLLLRPFYAFPCSHSFHADCLAAQLSPLLAPHARERLHDLQRQLGASSVNMDTASTGSVTLSPRDLIRTEIDTLLASQCLYCGDLTISLIDKPFIKDEDYDRILKEWE